MYNWKINNIPGHAFIIIFEIKYLHVYFIYIYIYALS